MADAKIKLENGATVTVSGSAEEIARIVSLYNVSPQAGSTSAGSPRQPSVPKTHRSDEERQDLDLSSILNTINDCEEAVAIEEKVLNQLSVVNRILMCLYINDKYFDSEPKLTTGDISKILGQLGIPVATPNVSITISRKGKGYVMTDSVRTKGAVVRYAINRRGRQYFEDVLSDKVSAPDRRVLNRPSKAERSKPSKSTDSSGSGDNKAKTKSYKPKYNAELDLLGLKEFIDRYVLNNNSEYVVAFVKYLRGDLQLDLVDGSDIYTCFVELKKQVKLPGSFVNTLKNAQNRDHLIGYEGGFTNVTLTPKGENIFNHDIAMRKDD